jgi:hypothetical protein
MYSEADNRSGTIAWEIKKKRSTHSFFKRFASTLANQLIFDPTGGNGSANVEVSAIFRYPQLPLPFPNPNAKGATQSPCICSAQRPSPRRSRKKIRVHTGWKCRYLSCGFLGVALTSLSL